MITHETISVDSSDPQVYRVDYVQIDDDIDMGGKLIFDRSNVAYIIKEVEACAQDGHHALRAQRRGKGRHARRPKSSSVYLRST